MAFRQSFTDIKLLTAVRFADVDYYLVRLPIRKRHSTILNQFSYPLLSLIAVLPASFNTFRSTVSNFQSSRRVKTWFEFTLSSHGLLYNQLWNLCLHLLSIRFLLGSCLRPRSSSWISLLSLFRCFPLSVVVNFESLSILFVLMFCQLTRLRLINLGLLVRSLQWLNDLYMLYLLAFTSLIDRLWQLSLFCWLCHHIIAEISLGWLHHDSRSLGVGLGPHVE